VIPLQPHGQALPLFCICGIHLYQELADQFAPEVPVFGIFVPGDEDLYDSATNDAVSSLSVERMASDYVRAVRHRQPHGPYRLVGVSFGGVLAYEAAQQLNAAGEEVSYLALLDTMLPSALGRNWIRWVLEHLRKIRQRGPRELVRKIAGRFNRAGPPAVEPASVADETERLAALRQAVYRAVTRRYLPKPYRGFAMLVRAEDQAFFKSDIADPTYGWGRLVDRLKIGDVPGDHLSILTQPNVSLLAKTLRAAAPFDLSAPAPAAAVAAPATATPSKAASAEGDGGETVERIDQDVVPANPVGLTVKSV
jgi:thioesterase domain-containing protein